MIEAIENKILRQDLTGEKFNKLTVIGFAHVKNGKSYWDCLCECGKKVTVVGGNLKGGLTRSCGCLRTRKFNPGESGLKSLYSKYGISARKEDRKFELTLEEFKELTSCPCSYCGTEPATVSSAEHTKDPEVKEYTSYKYNGIDRIDSSRGYEKGNVVSCCWWCNIIKRERTAEELKAHINRIFNHLKSVS